MLRGCTDLPGHVLSAHSQHLLGIFSMSAWDVFRYGGYNGSENEKQQMIANRWSNMTENAIEIMNLTKVYGSGDAAVHALGGVDVQVKRKT